MPDIPHVHICEDCEEEFECLNINCKTDSGYVCDDCSEVYEDDDDDFNDLDSYDDSVD